MLSQFISSHLYDDDAYVYMCQSHIYINRINTSVQMTSTVDAPVSLEYCLTSKPFHYGFFYAINIVGLVLIHNDSDIFGRIEMNQS